MAANAPFVSSLRASLAPAAPSAASAASAPASSGAFGAFANPFASLSASSLAAAVGSSASAVESRKVVMSAFSGLDLALDASLADNSSGGRSAARELLAKKHVDRQAELQAEAARLQVKQQQLQQQQQQKKPLSALAQALDAFDGEVEAHGAFQSRSTQAKGGSGSLSRRARQKKERAKERAEGYEGRRGGEKTRGGVLRRQKYKKI